MVEIDGLSFPVCLIHFDLLCQFPVLIPLFIDQGNQELDDQIDGCQLTEQEAWMWFLLTKRAVQNSCY